MQINIDITRPTQAITSEPHFQHSCEVYLKGKNWRKTVYGRTREEVLDDQPFLSLLLNGYPIREGWEDEVVVTQTRTVAMGLGPLWARGTRRRNAYGDVE